MKNTLNPIVFQKVKGKREIIVNNTSKDKYKPDMNKVEEEKCEEVKQGNERPACSDDGLILLNILFSLFPYANYPSSKI